MTPEQIDFVGSDVRGMVHRRARPTEVAAAEVIKRGLSDLQGLVLAAVVELGQATAEEVEQLPRFATFGPSTVRKRLSELSAARALIQCGTKPNSRGRPMAVWKAKK